MDKTKTVKTRKTPTPAFAVISFLVIVAVLVALINLGVDTTMSVFIAALIAVVIALLLDIPWADVERTLLRVVSDCIPTFLIVIMVGMLVGIWMAGGTVPALMYYGMKLISPKILVPLAFVLSGLTAEFTGTSFGSVATMGIALVGVLALALPLGGTAACVGLAIIGLGCAPIYPSIIHSTPAYFGPERSQAMIGVQMASAYTGSCLMPPAFGLLANHVSIGLLPVYLLAVLLLMAVMHERLLKKASA